MKMFATLDKAKPDTENIRGSNLAAVMCTTVQVSKRYYLLSLCSAQRVKVKAVPVTGLGGL
jgi:hypothetical protein